MKCIQLSNQLIVLATSLVLSNGAMAEAMNKDQYELEQRNTESAFESAMKRCNTLKDNPKDTCVVAAKGKMKITMATLKANFEPTLENKVDARIALIEANYALSNEKCDDAKDKSACIEQAKNIKDKEIANARAVK